MSKTIDKNYVKFEFVGSEDGEFGRYKTDKNGDLYFVSLGNDIKVTEVSKDVDSGQITLTLEFEYNGSTVTQTINRGDINTTKLLQLANTGGDVASFNLTYLQKHLMNQEEHLPIKNVHSFLGWHKVGEEENEHKAFFHQKAIGCHSEYDGDRLIEPKGSYKVWLDMIEEEIIGHTELELSLVVGFSASVIGYIGESVDVNNLIFHIYGNTSQGKTTFGQIAASIAGSPEIRKSGLASTFSATWNALFGNFKGNFGLPLLLDESSIKTDTDFTKFIYLFFSGQGKRRMNREAELKSVGSWGTSLITTGENSLRSASNQNSGLDMRIIEIGNVVLTKSSSNADRIKQVVKKNYGHAITKFSKNLMNIGEDKLIRRFKAIVGDLVEKVEVKKATTQRLSKSIALLILTSEIVNETFEFQLDLEGVYSFLFNQLESKNSKDDIGDRAIEHLLETVSIKSQYFIDISKESSVSNINSYNDTWGWIKDHRYNDKKELLVHKGVFKKILKEGRFVDVDVILNEWENSKLLYTLDSDNRKTCQRTINGRKSRYYVILLEEEKTRKLRHKSKVTDIKDMFGDGA